MSPVLESELDSVADVTKRGVTLYMGGFPQPGGLLHTKFHKTFVPEAQVYVRQSGGIYPFPNDHSIQDDIMEDILENGAAVVNSERTMNANAKRKPQIYEKLRVRIR